MLPLLRAVLMTTCIAAQAQPADTRLTRIAEIQIDPTRLEAYKAALREGLKPPSA